MKIFTYLCVLVLILIGVSFSLLNADKVTVNYFFGTSVLPASFLIIISIAIGAIVSSFFWLVKTFRQKSIEHGLKMKIEILEKALSASTTSSIQ